MIKVSNAASMPYWLPKYSSTCNLIDFRSFYLYQFCFNIKGLKKETIAFAKTVPIYECRISINTIHSLSGPADLVS